MAATHPDFITPKELASDWQLSEKTLSNWRGAGLGPPYVKFNRTVRYSREGSARWLAEEQDGHGGAA